MKRNNNRNRNRNSNRNLRNLRNFLLISGSSLLAVSSANAQTVIYEPFANSDLTLNGNAAGTGLTGNWAATANLGVTVGSSLAWGAIPTSGNRVAATAGGNTTASVGLSSALSNSGLLADGSSVWFSMMFNTPTNNGINEDSAFILGTDTLGGGNGIPIANSGSGLGFTFNSGGLRATSYSGGTRTQATGVALTTNTNYLITGQLIFGTNGAPDTVKLYLPTTGLVLGGVQSFTSATLSQSAFDTLAFGMKSNTAVGFDEIRFGGTYLDSIGMSAASSYWDLNGTAAGAGGATPTGTWDASSTRWNATAAGDVTAPAAWTAGRTAVFSAGTDATGSYTVTVDGTQSIGGLIFKNGSVTISPGTLGALDLVSAGGAIEVRDATKTATIATAITQSSGSGVLYKEGGGTLVLSGDNTYDSNTIINAGTLQLSGNNTGATGNITLNGGMVRFDSVNSINGTTGRTVTVNANTAAMFGTLSDADIATGLGRIVTTSAGIIAADNNAGGNFNLNTAGLTAVGFGAVGTVNYTGTLTPNGNYRLGGLGGSLTMANANAITGAAKTLTVSGPGTVTLASSNNYTGATTVNSGATLIMSGSTTTNGVTINAGGTLVAGAAGALGSGAITQSGTLSVGASGPGGVAITLNGSSVTSSDSTTARSISNRIVMNGNFTLGNATNNGKLTFNDVGGTSTTGSAARTITVNSNVEFSSALGGTGGITKAGSATLILSGTNTYTSTNIVSAGTLQFAKQASLYNNTAGSWTAANINVKSGATLALNVDSAGTNGFTDTSLNTLLTNISVAGSTTAGLQLGARLGLDTSTATGGSFTQGNIIANSTGVNGGAIGLTKLGTGTLVFDKVNTYTGSTNINEGTLRIIGSGAINSGSTININGGTLQNNSSANITSTINFISGTVAGTNLDGISLTIGAGQTLSPGNSPGTMVVANQTWANDGTYLWEINDANATAGADPGWDLLSGTGTLNITATAGNPFDIMVTSLNLGNTAGNATNFDQTLSYNWLIADFANPVTGFDVNVFNVDTSGFTNSFTGSFAIALGNAVGGDTSQLYLTYTGIPEPSTALLGGLGVFGLLLRRRR